MDLLFWLYAFSDKYTAERCKITTLDSYVKENNIGIVMFSEVYRIGCKVIDVLNIVYELHKAKLTVYIQQFDMLSFVDGKENSIFKCCCKCYLLALRWKMT